MFEEVLQLTGKALWQSGKFVIENAPTAIATLARIKTELVQIIDEAAGEAVAEAIKEMKDKQIENKVVEIAEKKRKKRSTDAALSEAIAKILKQMPDESVKFDEIQ